MLLILFTCLLCKAPIPPLCGQGKHTYVLLHIPPNAPVLDPRPVSIRTMLPHPAFSCFCPLHDCPLDGTHGVWVPSSQTGLPDPWVEASFPSLAGDSLVLDSRTIHCGGGRSSSLPSTTVWRVVAFATLVAKPTDYDANEVAFRPPWAGQRQPFPPAAAPTSCHCRDCHSLASGRGCPLCGTLVCLPHHHMGELCAACYEAPPQAPPHSLHLKVFSCAMIFSCHARCAHRRGCFLFRASWGQTFHEVNFLYEALQRHVCRASSPR